MVIHTITLDERNNVIDVGLSWVDPAWVTEVERRVDPSLVVFHAAEPVVPGACSKDNCLPPERLRAGLTLSASGSLCTSGFVVHNGSNSQLLTAGHCFNGGGVGQTVYQTGVSIGTVSAIVIVPQNAAIDHGSL